MIIGITGTDGAGKGAIVDYLIENKGFTHYSARAIWEEEFRNRGIESNRVNTRLIANELRATNGNDFLVTHYLKVIESEQPAHAVIESIRTTAEANTLKAHGGILLCVDADRELRYKRIQGRKSALDQVSFEKFVELEELEMNDPNPHGMQKAKVMVMADWKIENNGTREELHEQIALFLKDHIQ